jgi:hypothetical protein
MSRQGKDERRGGRKFFSFPKDVVDAVTALEIDGDARPYLEKIEEGNLGWIESFHSCVKASVEVRTPGTPTAKKIAENLKVMELLERFYDYYGPEYVAERGLAPAVTEFLIECDPELVQAMNYPHTGRGPIDKAEDRNTFSKRLAQILQGKARIDNYDQTEA